MSHAARAVASSCSRVTGMDDILQRTRWKVTTETLGSWGERAHSSCHPHGEERGLASDWDGSALKKADGGVRGIVVGDIMRRFVARTTRGRGSHSSLPLRPFDQGWRTHHPHLDRPR